MTGAVSFSRLPAAVTTAVLLAVGAQSSLAQESLPGQSAEKTYSVTLEAKRQTKACYPNTSVEYLQKGNVAAVTGTITVDGCARASGRYLVSVRVRGDDGTLETLEFEELWSRDDDAPLELEKEYPIGDDVDLIRVRFRSRECECADVPDPAE